MPIVQLVSVKHTRCIGQITGSTRSKHEEVATTRIPIQIPFNTYPDDPHDPNPSLPLYPIMKFNLALLGGVITLCSIPVQAQYFSQGWKPGQPAHTKAPAVNSQGWTPGQKVASPRDAASAPDDGSTSESATSGGFDVDKLLVSALNKFGFNLSVPATAENGGLWDDRIPLITDDNYEDLIVNEQFASDEEAAKRAWVLVM